MNPRRLATRTLIAAICGTTAAAAWAQAAAAPDAAGRMQDLRAKLAARFAAADADHDGKLTRDEAEGKMPLVARSFEQIDKNHRGYVTLDDIQAYVRERIAQRQMARSGATD